MLKKLFIVVLTLAILIGCAKTPDPIMGTVKSHYKVFDGAHYLTLDNHRAIKVVVEVFLSVEDGDTCTFFGKAGSRYIWRVECEWSE